MVRTIYYFKKRLSSALSSFYQNITKRESIIKGDEFENFLREKIYTPDKYILLHKTHSFSKGKAFVESSLYPDFLFKEKNTGEEFYVEAKYRSYLVNGKIEWCRKDQFDRYKKIAKDKKTLIAIGFKGRPTFSQKNYIVNINDIDYPYLYPNTIKDYEYKSIKKGLVEQLKDKIYN